MFAPQRCGHFVAFIFATVSPAQIQGTWEPVQDDQRASWCAPRASGVGRVQMKVVSLLLGGPLVCESAGFAGQAMPTSGKAGAGGHWGDKKKMFGDGPEAAN